jgi:hypothetical protein
MQIKAFLKSLAALSGALFFCAGLTGCMSNFSDPIATAHPFAAGNWQFASTDPKASVLPQISGSLTGPSNQVSGLLHVDVAGACVPQTNVIEVSGWSDQGAAMVLNGPLAGGTFTFQGVLAADGLSMEEASYKVVGGSCAFPWVSTTAQNYAAVGGTYAGTFKDSSGLSSTLTATLSQSPQSDVNGNYSLTGQGTFAAFPCLTNSAQLTSTEVTGSNVKMTNVDPVTSDSVAVLGQLASDGKSMAVTSWTLAGGCSPDSGTGSLVLQD